MADMTAICTALAGIVDNVPGLRVSPQFVAQVNPPMAVIMPGPQASMTFDTTDGGISLDLRIELLVSYAEDASSVALLQGYLATKGAQSVYDQILANPRLGGVVDYTVANGFRSYGLRDWAGQTYLAATIPVTIMAKTP